ncbi:hypothetical protein [Streptomyces sp. NPDC055085]
MAITVTVVVDDQPFPGTVTLLSESKAALQSNTYSGAGPETAHGIVTERKALIEVESEEAARVILEVVDGDLSLPGNQKVGFHALKRHSSLKVFVHLNQPLPSNAT